MAWEPKREKGPEEPLSERHLARRNTFPSLHEEGRAGNSPLFRRSEIQKDCTKPLRTCQALPLTLRLKKHLWTMSNITDRTTTPEEEAVEQTLRPQTLDEYVGQESVKRNLRVAMEAAKMRGDVLEHLLLAGPPGLGKTTLAYLIAREMGANLRATSGAAIERIGDLAAILTNLEDRDVLFIDEAHRLPRAVEEVLYPAIEAQTLDIILGKGTAARTLKLTLPRFTLISATTRPSLLSAPLRSRFGQSFHLDFYRIEEIDTILERSASILALTLEKPARRRIAEASRMTPRVANRLLKRIRDLAQVEGGGTDARITDAVAQRGLTMLGVDARGLETLDRNVLRVLIERFRGGPVGIQAVAATLNEDEGTIAEVVEPYLLQIGMLARTGRGRVATDAAFAHLDLTPPADRQALFS